jgi:hypothetical protein
MDHHGAFVLAQVGEPGFVHDVLLVAHRPGGPCVF